MNVAWKRKFTASATTQFPADLLWAVNTVGNAAMEIA